MSQNGAGTLIKTKPRCERNRVLVTGGAGFVGSHLCDYLVARGDHVGLGLKRLGWVTQLSSIGIRAESQLVAVML